MDNQPPDSPAWWASEARRYADRADDIMRQCRWYALAAFACMICALGALITMVK